MKILTFLTAVFTAVCFAACSSAESGPAQAETSAAVTTAETAPETTVETAAPAAEETTAETAAPAETYTQTETSESVDSEPEPEIEITALDDEGNYSFEFDGMTFYACYTPDNWHIIDSYRVRQMEDMKVICRALIELHPVHGSDMESWRTPEDMAEEWIYHDLAYELLPDDDPWKERAKDVDLDPADQGKTLHELFIAKSQE